MNNKVGLTADKNKRSSKTASYIILCFFAAFNVCFFMPLDVFLANSEDIAFPIMPLCIGLGLVTLIAFAIMLAGCLLIKGKANDVFRALIFGVSMAFYIQGNFLAVNMGELNGSEYEMPVWRIVLNAIVWLAVLAAPFFILTKHAKIFDNVVSYIPAAVLLIQMVALSASAVMNIPKYCEHAINMTVNGYIKRTCTTIDLDLYSENKNLIVIVADEYDSFIFDKVVEENPGILSEFDGFTYYTNTVGKFDFTNMSLANILTNSLTAEYDNRTLFQNLTANFKTNFYHDTIVPPIEILSNYSDNIVSKTVGQKDMVLYTGAVYKISFFRCMPNLLKPLFWSSGNIAQELREKSQANAALEDGLTEYGVINVDFYNNMPRTLRTTDENIFKFICVFGLHAPLTTTRDITTAEKGQNVTRDDSAVAVNKMINEYLRTLKDAGVYDNSEIIFMADHGHFDYKQFPLLMYKPANQTETGIKVSNAPISYDDIYPTLILLSGGEPEARTIFDIGEDEERVRHFIPTNEDIIGNIKQDPALTPYGS